MEKLSGYLLRDTTGKKSEGKIGKIELDSSGLLKTPEEAQTMENHGPFRMTSGKELDDLDKISEFDRGHQKLDRMEYHYPMQNEVES